MITTTLTTLLPDVLSLLLQFGPSDATNVAAMLGMSVPPPIQAETMIKEIATWLTKILSAVAFLFLIIDLFKHVTASPRDLGAAGKDIFVMIILIAIATRAEAIVSWGQSLL